MAESAGARRGCLLIADISGYTAYLTGSELEHAQGILGELIGSILESIRPHFAVGNLEGDAVFAYAPREALPAGQTLLDVIESAYCDFGRTREHMERNTSCPCQACSNISGLDLKFVAHFGSYLRSRLGEREELSGPDVVLVHRLLKNSIVEALGVPAYAFVTEACLAELGVGEALGGLAHTERYEHFEPVSGRVLDLREAQARRPAAEIRVEPGEAWFEVDCRSSLPAARIWEQITEPERRRVWLESDAVLESGGPRRGVGTVQHCQHGGSTFDHVIVDWEPCSRVTYEIRLPFGARVRSMAWLEADGDLTRVLCRFSRVRGRNGLHTAAVRVLMRAFSLERTLRRSSELLEGELRAAETQAAGVEAGG